MPGKQKLSRQTFTDKYVRAIRPPATGRKELWDARLPGFGLRVSSSGRKTWQVMTRLSDGRPSRLTLGVYPGMTLREAREAANDKIRAVKKGRDPATEKRQAREAAEAVVARNSAAKAQTGYRAGTFGELAETYIARGCPKKKGGGSARPQEIASIIRRYLLPALGNKRLAEIRRRDIIRLTEAVVDVGKTQLANRLQRITTRLFNYAIQRDEIDLDLSPIAGMERPAEATERERRLDHKKKPEIQALWLKAWAPMGFPFGVFHQLCLVTGQRRTEVARLRWQDLDLDHPVKFEKGEVVDGPTWTLPTKFTKNKKGPHVVPLSPLALALLRSVPRVDPVWVLSTRRGCHISGYSKAKATADRLSGVKDWVVHDLRRTAGTNLQDLGFSEAVIGAVLNHSAKHRAGVTAIYARHPYDKEKRQALNDWGRRLEGLINPQDNVVSLRGGVAE